MPTEDCGICGAPVPLADATHLLVNPSDADEVTDMYVCASCYEEDLRPLLAGEEDPGESADAPEEDPDGSADAPEAPEGA